MNEMDKLETVQKLQFWIKSHLQEPMTLKQLSDISGYSPWHTSRMFKEVTGKNPFDYIRSLRLSSAALVLRDQKCKVLDVALDFVFDSHEGFTRAFSKQFGLSPKQYQKKTPPIGLFRPYLVLESYQALHRGGKHMTKKTQTIFVQIIERPQRKLLLKRGIKATEYFAYCDEVGCDVWSILCSVKEAMVEPVGLWLPDHLIKEGTSQYVQGVEVPMDYSNQIPQGFDLIDLPSSTYMFFQSEPYEDINFGEAIADVWKHIETFNPTIYGYDWDPQAAPRFQLEPQGYRGYIEALPVKQVKR